MASITLEQARLKFTQALVDKYREMPIVMSFLRSFFVKKTSTSKYISIEVQRGNEKIAVDVQRGTPGNRNEFGRSTQKIILPPYFREYFDATDLDFYDLLFTDVGGMVDGKTFANWINEVNEKLKLLQQKIERRQELQCAQVLEDGIVTLENGDNIDFKRKALSKVTIVTKWDDGASDPIVDLLVGCNFIRQEGKAQGGLFNLILGQSALEALINNAKITSRADIRRYELAVVHEPQKNSVGATLHGRITVGSYVVLLWAYPEFYDDAGGTSTPYLNAKKVILIPQVPRFIFSFAAVPMIKRDLPKAEFANFISQVQGSFVVGNYIDERDEKHVFDVKSSGVPIPVAVDQIWTAAVLA